VPRIATTEGTLSRPVLTRAIRINRSPSLASNRGSLCGREIAEARHYRARSRCRRRASHSNRGAERIAQV
jgi:hypothetical protein